MSGLRDAGWRAWGASAAIAVGLGLVVERLWVTDAEAIGARLAALGDALEAQDAGGALAAFAEDFAADGVDRRLLGVALEVAVSRHAPSRARVREATITVDGDAATSTVRWQVNGRVESQPVPGLVDVTFAWRRGPDGWRITGIDGGRPFAWSAPLGDATHDLRPWLARAAQRR